MPPAATIRDVSIPSTVGPLEGVLNIPDAPAGRAAVVCHPHPLFGGTMHSHVVYHTARALRERGLVVLRFNFRGVGRSPGAFDDGRGEQDDVVAALDFLAGEAPGAPLTVGGFSFGSWVGLQAGIVDPRVSNLIAIGMPVENRAFDFLLPNRKPLAIIQGAGDEYGDPADIRRIVADLPGPVRMEEIPGAGHFFRDRFDELRAALNRAVDWLEEAHG